MPSPRLAQLTLWAVYALVVAVHLGALLTESSLTQRVTQPLFAPLLIAILLVSAPSRHRTTVLLTAGLFFAWLGDTMPPFLPQVLRPAAVVLFLVALVLYCVALLPLWARNREPLRLALAIPYAGVVIGLFVACADGADEMTLLVAAYATVLATMDWFLPGAAIMYSTVWVMLTYALGQALLVAGILRIIPSREHTMQPVGAELVIVEG